MSFELRDEISRTSIYNQHLIQDQNRMHKENKAHKSKSRVQTKTTHDFSVYYWWLLDFQC